MAGLTSHSLHGVAPMHHQFDFKSMLVFELLQRVGARVVEPQVALGYQDAAAGHAPKAVTNTYTAGGSVGAATNVARRTPVG